MLDNTDRLRGHMWWAGQALAVVVLILFACMAFKVAKGYVSESQYTYFGVMLPCCVATAIVCEYKFRLPRFVSGVLSFILVMDGQFSQGLLRAKFLDPEYYAATLPLLGPSLLEGTIGATLLGSVWYAFSTTVEQWIYGKKKATAIAKRASSESRSFQCDIPEEL